MLMPPTPWLMPREERVGFLDTMAKLKLPTGYASGFKKHVIKGKLASMKSHDYHVLFQQILPLCLQHRMTREPQVAIMRICKVFKLIFSKVYDLTTYQGLNNGVIYSLCLFEKVFPPSFFDLMTHVVVHLVDELEICGLVHSHWMYPIE